jgi:hypothetical protein
LGFVKRPQIRPQKASGCQRIARTLWDDETQLFYDFSRVFLEFSALTGRQWTSAELYGKWDGWPPHPRYKRLFMRGKYFLTHYEGPKKAPRTTGFLGTSGDDNGSKVPLDKQIIDVILRVALRQLVVGSDRSDRRQLAFRFLLFCISKHIAFSIKVGLKTGDRRQVIAPQCLENLEPSCSGARFITNNKIAMVISNTTLFDFWNVTPKNRSARLPEFRLRKLKVHGSFDLSRAHSRRYMDRLIRPIVESGPRILS